MYARIENQAVVEYPYTLAQLREAHPNTSFAVNITDEELATYGVVRVVVTGQPAHDWLTENCVETTPVFATDQWEQNWLVVSVSPEEVEARKQMVKAQITADVQQRLDAFARTRGYDDIVSACSYATSQHTKYGPEGRYCVQAREDTWDVLFQIEADVLAENRPMPQSYADIESELPALQWPI